MKLTPQLQYIQEKLVLAAHPGFSLEEATQRDFYSDWYYDTQRFGDREQNKNEFIGLPPTLSRVLNGLGKMSYYEGGVLFINKYHKGGYVISSHIGYWKLLNDDGSDATLFDQSEDTIIAIAREMGYK